MSTTARLGLPIGNPARLREWARRADDAGFSTVALLDRLAFSKPEPLVTLAALAGPGQLGSPVGPAPATPGGPSILIGGFAPRALARVARHGDGFICAAPLEWAEPLIASVRRDWQNSGRAGHPRIVCQVNVALGSSGTVDDARAALADYYAFTGRPGWGAPVTDAAHLTDTIRGCAALGADELILYCWADGPDQVDRLASFTG